MAPVYYVTYSLSQTQNKQATLQTCITTRPCIPITLLRITI